MISNRDPYKGSRFSKGYLMEEYSEEQLDKAYEEYVARHYSTESGPITQEFFLEVWEELTAEERRDLLQK